MSNLKKRAISSVLYVALFLLALYFGEITSLIWFGLLSLICLWEFYQLFKEKDIRPIGLSAVVVGVFAFLAMATQHGDSNWWPLLIAFLALLCVVELFKKQQEPLLNLSVTFMGMLYICAPLALLYRLGFYSMEGMTETFNMEVLLGYFFILWTNDTAAYFLGSKWGKRKLMPSISPKKSWEGFWGGILFGLQIGYLNSVLFSVFDSLTWLIISLIVGVFGSLGDLVESSFKRSLNIKDSSQLIPGHGGILDRLDGVFISAPMVYVALHYLSSL
ncbi:MAG: phosphatidate cytidylyltransferase [Verrucomicrobia bacterium]|nr:phosphatidate cytidylyltransferase [Verrucomicrobiota bacterium]